MESTRANGTTQDGKIIHMHEEDIDEDDGFYVRAPGEYTRPRAERALVDRDAFAMAEVKRDAPWDDKEAFIVAATGTDHNRGLENCEDGWLWCEIVPELWNPYDGEAVAVDINGTRAGYLSSGIARHYHWMIRSLNLQGFAIFVAGSLRDDSEEIDAEKEVGLSTSRYLLLGLPTLTKMEAIPEIATTVAALTDLYYDLPDQTHALIIKDHFHILRTEVVAEVLSRRHLVPYLQLPEQADTQELPPIFDQVLKRARLRYSQEQSVLRAQVRADRERSREEERRAAQNLRAEKKAARAEQVLALHKSGASRSKIAAEIGASQRTVSNILTASGIAPSTGGFNAYSEEQAAQRRVRARESLRLQRDGQSRKQIAEELSMSPETISILLSLGKFLEDPASYPDRYQLALQANREGWTRSTVSGGVRQRAIGDARDLRSVNPAAL